MSKALVAGPLKGMVRPASIDEKARTSVAVTARTACPGCLGPVAVRGIYEALDDLQLLGKAIVIRGIGCAIGSISRIGVDSVLAAHGRAPDVATAIKRILKYPLVFTAQGDGDCFAIGAGSLMNAAARGEKITVIMFNNTIYGTTGGQMGPTTTIGQKTTTTPEGRDPTANGYPAHVPELMAALPGVAYSARGSVNNPANLGRVKKYLKKAFQAQMEGLGLSLVEIIIACPTNWHLSPIDSLKFAEEKVLPEFPLGEFRNTGAQD